MNKKLRLFECFILLIFEIPAGVPQGSLLSPHLFNMFINDIPKPKHCRLAIYADDTALYSSVMTPNLNSLITIIENGLKEIETFFNGWRIKINDSKTEAILFSHSTIMQREKQKFKIKHNNNELQWKTAVKYLGVMMDQKLLYRSNIDYLINKAKKNIAVLYPLLKKRSKLNFHSKLTIYRSYIRPIITYACPVWSNTAKTHMNKIQVLQNKSLRMVLDAPYITKIEKLHRDTQIPFIENYIKKLTINFYKKLTISDNKLIKKLGCYNHNSFPFRIKHKLPKKLIMNE